MSKSVKKSKPVVKKIQSLSEGIPPKKSKQLQRNEDATRKMFTEVVNKSKGKESVKPVEGSDKPVNKGGRPVGYSVIFKRCLTTEEQAFYRKHKTLDGFSEKAGKEIIEASEARRSPGTGKATGGNVKQGGNAKPVENPDKPILELKPVKGVRKDKPEVKPEVKGATPAVQSRPEKVMDKKPNTVEKTVKPDGAGRGRGRPKADPKKKKPVNNSGALSGKRLIDLRVKQWVEHPVEHKIAKGKPIYPNGEHEVNMTYEQASAYTLGARYKQLRTDLKNMITVDVEQARRMFPKMYDLSKTALGAVYSALPFVQASDLNEIVSCYHVGKQLSNICPVMPPAENLDYDGTIVGEFCKASEILGYNPDFLYWCCRVTATLSFEYVSKAVERSHQTGNLLRWQHFLYLVASGFIGDPVGNTMLVKIINDTDSYNCLVINTEEFTRRCINPETRVVNNPEKNNNGNPEPFLRTDKGRVSDNEVMIRTQNGVMEHSSIVDPEVVSVETEIVENLDKIPVSQVTSVESPSVIDQVLTEVADSLGVDTEQTEVVDTPEMTVTESVIEEAEDDFSGVEDSVASLGYTEDGGDSDFVDYSPDVLQQVMENDAPVSETFEDLERTNGDVLYRAVDEAGYFDDEDYVEGDGEPSDFDSDGVEDIEHGVELVKDFFEDVSDDPFKDL